MKLRFLIFFLALSLTSCSLLTKSGRQQRAYEKYVRKSSLARQHQRSKFKFRNSEIPIRQSAPTLTETAPESPESVTAPESQPSPQ